VSRNKIDKLYELFQKHDISPEPLNPQRKNGLLALQRLESINAAQYIDVSEPFMGKAGAVSFADMSCECAPEVAHFLRQDGTMATRHS
jgi:hypothetical protein